MSSVSAQQAETGQDILEYTNRLMDCEENLQFQDVAVSEAMKEHSLLIVVLRLGKGEASSFLCESKVIQSPKVLSNKRLET